MTRIPSLDHQCLSGKKTTLVCFFIDSSLDEGLGEITAVDFDVDLCVVLLLLLLLVEVPPVEEQEEGQQEAQHTEHQKSDVDLEDNGS